MTALALTAVFVVAVALVNAWATHAILGDRLSTTAQRAAQVSSGTADGGDGD